MTTFYLLIWVAFCFVCAVRDKNGRKPNYGGEIMMRCVVGFLFLCLFVKRPEQWPLMIAVLLFIPTTFWNLFELFLNMLRGKWKDLLYYDHQEGDSGFIDNYFRKKYLKRGDHKAHTIWKMVSYAVMIGSVILIYILHGVV